jgi:hypothetical protein
VSGTAVVINCTGSLLAGSAEPGVREPERSRVNWHTVSQPHVAHATDPLPAADRSRKQRFERISGWYHSV